MKQNLKRLLFLLCIALLLPCLTLGASAVSYGDESDPDDANGAYYDKNGYVVWEFDADTDTIIGLGKEYVYYLPTMNLWFEGSVMYHYENQVEFFYGSEALYSYAANPEILMMYASDSMYVTEAGRVSLEALQNGNAVTYRLKTGTSRYDGSSPLDASFVKELQNGTEKKSFDVRTLKDKIVGNVIGYDGTDAYACNYGGVYVVSDEYYYIHYMTLGNQYFDADGEFSYRSGTVEAIKLTDEQAQHVATLLSHVEYKGFDIVYESDQDLGETHEDGAIVMFVFFMILVGFVAPLPLLIVSICMARSAKRGHPTYWYGLTAVSAAWMVVTLILLIVLL